MHGFRVGLPVLLLAFISKNPYDLTLLASLALAGMAELVDAPDSKSDGSQPCGFESHSRHHWGQTSPTPSPLRRGRQEGEGQLEAVKKWKLFTSSW